MSNYQTLTKNPVTGEMEMAEWLDDYFGAHIYGVRFPGGEIYHERDVEGKKEVVRDDVPD